MNRLKTILTSTLFLALAIAWSPATAATISNISSGANHSLALRSDGTTLAWGDNDSDQCSIPTGAQTQVSAVAAGTMFSLALKNGSVVGWGDNSYGQVEIPAAAQSGVSAISAGGTFSLALKSGKVLAWGDNSFGQCTVPLGAQSGVIAISAGFGHALALKGDGTVVAWGANFSKQATVPPGTSGVKAIAAGFVHSLALKTDGSVIAWGDASRNASSVPGAAQTGVSSIAAGGNFSMALKGGIAILWGDAPGGPPYPSDSTLLTAGGAFATALNGSGQIISLASTPSQPGDLLLVTLNFSGTGSGTVNSIPSGFTCSSGTCTSVFAQGASLTLVPTSSAGSSFSGWSGACTGSGNCGVAVTSPVVVTATFSASQFQARILETGTLYSLIAQAYVAALSGNTIQIIQGPVVENLKFDEDKRVILHGGYDTAFNTRSGRSIIVGTMKIQKGGATTERIVLMPQ